MSTRNGIIGAVPATQVPRYAGKGTFARIADIHEVSDYDIAVLGVPFDGGTSYRPGARFGPMGVRRPPDTAPGLPRRARGRTAGTRPGRRRRRRHGHALTTSTEACQQIENHAARDPRRRGPPHRVDRWRPHHRAAESARACMPSTARSRWSTSMRTWTPGTPTSTPRSPTARSSAARSRRVCSSRTTRSTSAFAARSTTGWTSTTTPGWGSGSSAPATSTSWASTPRSTRCAAGRRRPGVPVIDIDVLDPAFAPGTGTPEARRSDLARAAADAPQARPGSTSSAPTSWRSPRPTTMPRSPAWQRQRWCSTSSA